MCEGMNPGDSCYESLVNGSYDISWWPEAYSKPMEQSDGKIMAFDPMQEYKSGITTPYDCSLERSLNESRQADILESINGFGIDTWLITIAFITVIAALFNVHLRMLKYKSSGSTGSGLWTVLTYLAKNPSAKEINWVSRLIAIVTALFTFLVFVCYFENVFLSSKVKVYQPKVYTSYAQLVSDDQVRMRIDTEATQSFKNAPIGSNYRKLYEKSQTKSSKHEVTTVYLDWMFSNDTESKAFIGATDPEADCRLLKMPKFNKNHPNWKKEGLCIHLHIPDDGNPDEQMFTESLVLRYAQMMSYGFTQKPIYAKYSYYYRRSYEMKLLHPYHSQAPSYSDSPPSVDECKPKKNPVTHDPDPTAFELINFRYAITALCIPIIAALIALNYERFKKTYLAPQIPIRYVHAVQNTK